MLDTCSISTARAASTLPHRDAHSLSVCDAHRTADALQLIVDNVSIQRRMVRAAETVYQAGQRFTHLHVVNAGVYKIVNLSADGRDQIVSLKFRGDWLGLDGIADGVHDCDAVALDTGEVWALPYDALMRAGAACPALLGALHGAMSREIASDHNSLMSVCTLPADARVAEFLCNWARALSKRGLRTDQITIRLTRAEIGNYLGVTLETVSRALSRLARCDLIEFAGKGRRDLVIPAVEGLAAFVQDCLVPAPASH